MDSPFREGGHQPASKGKLQGKRGAEHIHMEQHHFALPTANAGTADCDLPCGYRCMAEQPKPSAKAQGVGAQLPANSLSTA